MKTSYLTLAFGAFVALLVSSCTVNLLQPEPGRIVDEWREVSGYTKLDVSRAMRVEVTVGGTDSIRINASEGFMQYIRTEVVGGVLRIYVDDNIDISRLAGDGVFITVPALTEITASGASVVVCNDTLQANDFSMRASGASGIDCSILADIVSLNSSGASFFDLRGECDSFNALVSGASIVRSFDLQTRVTTANLSGASLMETSTSQTLTVTASGASALFYRGNPQVQQNVSGGSEVKKDG